MQLYRKSMEKFQNHSLLLNPIGSGSDVRSSFDKNSNVRVSNKGTGFNPFIDSDEAVVMEQTFSDPAKNLKIIENNSLLQ